VLRLATVRSHDQYNTTIYSMNDRYRGVYSTRTVIFMNKDDMAARAIAPHALVEIEAVGDDSVERRVRGQESNARGEIHPGCRLRNGRSNPHPRRDQLGRVKC
jgi:anaerobic selenocysteine-containing dehydrogenase